MTRQTRLGEHGLTMTLWALIVPPTIWAAHFLFCILWVAVTCAKTPEASLADFPLEVLLATIAAVLGISGAGYLARVKSRVPGDPPPHDGGTAVDRLRFLAVSTRLLAGLSLVAVLYTAVPVIIFGDCR